MRQGRSTQNGIEPTADALRNGSDKPCRQVSGVGFPRFLGRFSGIVAYINTDRSGSGEPIHPWCDQLLLLPCPARINRVTGLSNKAVA